MQERVIPQNITAEQNVLSAMLIDTHAADIVAERLQPEDFYRPSHQIICRAIFRLRSRNEPVDLVTVTEELKKENRLADVGDIGYLTLLANVAPTAANVKYHARIVEEKSLLRQMVESGTAIAAMGYEGGEEDVQDLIDRAEKNLLRLSCRKSATDFVPIQDIVSAAMDRLGSLVENSRAVTGLSTGFTDLDSITAGLHPSDFIIVAARPSMGKTALALNIAENVALRGTREGEPPRRVAFFSLEMSRDQLAQRMICTEADVGDRELRPAEPEDENEKTEVLDRLWAASDNLAASNIFIDDTPGLSIRELRSKARRLKAAGGLDLIVIDYLQLMQVSLGRSGSENRQHEVSEISRSLKALARELEAPVLALSQLSRSVENRQVKRPMLSDLRESGSLEQDADIVMFLYREDYYKAAEEEPTHLTELIVAKHRNGPTGKIDLFFRKDCTRFISLNE
ncbi:MAG: replicative DNA helicase, partial [Acidaminococcaceae bacterium]|nr:replicative DNA helicase [Acidaminococcaceae bacterium]